MLINTSFIINILKKKIIRNYLKLKNGLLNIFSKYKCEAHINYVLVKFNLTLNKLFKIYLFQRFSVALNKFNYKLNYFYPK